MAKVVTKHQVAVNSVVVDVTLITLYLCALFGLLWRFNRKHNISRVLQATSILFIVFYVVSWIIWMIADIIYLTDGSKYSWRVCMLLYSIVKYLLPCSAFYIFILGRLKMTFQGTMYEIPDIYFKIVGAAGTISLLLNTWWRVYGFTVPLQEFQNNHQLQVVITLCRYQFYFMDMTLQFSMIFLFEHRLFHLMSAIREEADPLSTRSRSCSEIAKDFNQRQQAVFRFHISMMYKLNILECSSDSTSTQIC